MKALNKGLLGTTHNLSLGNALRSLHSYRVQPVGRPQNPDVQRPEMMKKNDELAMATATARKLEK
jgi:hypothetical protein